jgi:RNA polymerase sigma-70 factor (ECF subfamily)
VESDLDHLLEEAARGSRLAYAGFVRATSREVHGFCRRMLGADDAEDAVQEVYLALWRSLGSFRFEASARTYLFVIARRVAVRHATRHRRWRELAGAVAAPEAVTATGAAVELHEALASLDLDKRTAIVLTNVLGFSYAEAATICGCPVGTIRSRVARAREQLSAGLTAAETG